MQDDNGIDIGHCEFADGGRIHLYMQVPTIYVRLLQGYDAMDAESQKACSCAARQLRLMVLSVGYL